MSENIDKPYVLRVAELIYSKIHIIKKDKPALIIEYNRDVKIIDQLLKKFSYKAYY